MHKIYAQHPPHDRQLYDILQVPPNATLDQIQKSYRQLSKLYHPDKRLLKQQQQQRTVQNEDDDRRLQQIQRAYEILRHYSTRVFYHKYGLTDPHLAVLLLLGPKLKNHLLRCVLQQESSSLSNDGWLFVDTLDQDLMRLMGYDEEMLLRQDNTIDLQERRIQNIASMLVERIRPVVEGQLVDPTVYGHVLAQDCDRWKRSPLGSQIIRCIGRAYRHVGQDFLSRHQSRYWNLPSTQQWNERGEYTTSRKMKHWQMDAMLGMRKRWHSAKHFLEAGAASCKLAVAEYLWNHNKTPQQHQPPKSSTTLKQQYEAIEYHGNEDENNDADSFFPLGIEDEIIFMALDELEIAQKRFEHESAQAVLIQAMQVEALWKACKIELVFVVRKACEGILNGEYFFFPSSTSEDPNFVPSRGTTDESIPCDTGWVAASNDITVNAAQARVTAAQTMVLLGDIMVHQSKQGTSWKN